NNRGFRGQPVTEQGSQLVGQAQTTTEPRTPAEVPDAFEANFSIRIQYRGEERTTELPFTKHMISRLALEAELREMRICELVSKLLMKTMKNDLLQRLLDPQKTRVGRHEELTP
ncbi:MAG TPA: hypothetical protein VLD66_06400, partial [Methyloceanibacter sp.]|nr:hypothetical protein [Methyloceanibacter sp.]